MSFRLNPTFREALDAADRPLVGMWVCSGSPIIAEICAGSGLDWLLIDAEHTPNSLETLLAQLHAVNGYPVIPVLRPPTDDKALLKRYLDMGPQNIIVPMVDTAEQAAEIARAISYPMDGGRGVGSALSRASRWNRVSDYLDIARSTLSLIVQIETAEAVRNVEAIVATPGVDGIFIGPSDLAASMGLLGQQEHPDVIAAVERCITAAKTAGAKVGVNAFAPARARAYLDAKVDFILVGADVHLLARGSEMLATDFIQGRG